MDGLTRGANPPGLVIHSQDDDVVGFLVFDNQPIPVGRKREMTRRPSQGWLALNEGESTGIRGYRKDGDGILASIRSVNKFAGRGNLDFGTSVNTLEIRG